MVALFEILFCYNFRTRNTYFDNDEDPYVPSGSEDEYSESEKILLEKVTKEKNAALEESEVSLHVVKCQSILSVLHSKWRILPHSFCFSQEEIYGLGDEDSDDEDGKGKMSDSDIEGKEDEDDNLPDVRAWGKKRKNFYRTDYVDEDYGGMYFHFLNALKCRYIFTNSNSMVILDE